MLGDADTIRARARDLVRSNPFAQGIVRARLRNVIGCGIRPQARIETAAGKPREAVNRQIEELWDRWQKRADLGGRLTFYEIQRLVYREVDEAGEVLLHFVEDRGDRSRPLPLAIELIDIDRLAADYLFPRSVNTDNGNEVRRGVEIDRQGRAVAYWLYDSHPQDLNTFIARPKRHLADEFLHIYRVERVGQTRGVSMFAPVIRALKDIGYYVENELQASAVAACFTAAIKTVDGPASGSLVDTLDDSASDTDGNRFEYLQPGMVARLFPGEEVETINPMRPNAAAEPWINLILRMMAIGTGLSYERLSRDYSGTNFSSNRAGDLEDRREFRPDQEWIIGDLCEPVWQRFLVSAVIERKVPITDLQLLASFDRYCRCAWQAPGWEWVDPQKEATASVVALRNNLTTLAEELGKRGRDLHDTLEQRKREKDLLAEMGLTEAADVPGVETSLETPEGQTVEEPEEEMAGAQS